MRLHLNEKKSKENQARLIGWYWKRKPTWSKDLITCNSHPWIMFSFNWLVKRGSFGHPSSRGWKNFGQRWIRGVAGLENWTIFEDFTCISSHVALISFNCPRDTTRKGSGEISFIWWDIISWSTWGMYSSLTPRKSLFLQSNTLQNPKSHIEIILIQLSLKVIAKCWQICNSCNNLLTLSS